MTCHERELKIEFGINIVYTTGANVFVFMCLLPMCIGHRSIAIVTVYHRVGYFQMDGDDVSMSAIGSSEVGVDEVLVCTSPLPRHIDRSMCDTSPGTMAEPGFDTGLEPTNDYYLDSDHALFQSDCNILVYII